MKEILDIKQVSQILKIPLRTVYRLVKQGKIRSIRIGGKVCCFKEDIDKYEEYGTDFSNVAVKIPQLHERTRGRSDRRSYPRIESNINCRYSISIPQKKEISDTGIIKNLSSGGVFILIQKSNTNGINIDDPISIDSINARGKVVWKNDKGFGIKFRGMSGGW